jgi:diacylglycerol kinase (CTP)
MKRSTAPAKMNSQRYSSASSAISAPLSIRLHVRSDLHLARKVWHMSLGLMIVMIYLLSGMSRSTAVVTVGSALGLNLLIEITRLRIPAFNERVLRVMGPFMRSCEINRLSGVPYYLSAAILSIGIFPQPIAVLSLMYLAFGDPIASLFGILYGDRSYRMASGKSLVGTSAAVLTCLVVSYVFMSSNLNLSQGSLLAMTLLGGLAGGLAELLPLEVDDNFSIPIVSGFILWLGFILMGI